MTLSSPSLPPYHHHLLSPPLPSTTHSPLFEPHLTIPKLPSHTMPSPLHLVRRCRIALRSLFAALGARAARGGRGGGVLCGRRRRRGRIFVWKGEGCDFHLLECCFSVMLFGLDYVCRRHSFTCVSGVSCWYLRYAVCLGFGSCFHPGHADGWNWVLKILLSGCSGEALLCRLRPSDVVRFPVPLRSGFSPPSIYVPLR